MVNKKSNNLAVCIICGILTVFGIVACIISLINGSGGIWIVNDVLYIAISVLIFYYAFCGYRKPHGNLLKYIILIYAVTRLISSVVIVELSGAVINVILVGLLCYIAGRLHKMKQNLILVIMVTAFIVIRIVMGFMDGITTIGSFTTFIIWFDICVAYFLRYKEHKEAGLMDAPKNKLE